MISRSRYPTASKSHWKFKFWIRDNPAWLGNIRNATRVPKQRDARPILVPTSLPQPPAAHNHGRHLPGCTTTNPQQPSPTGSAVKAATEGQARKREGQARKREGQRERECSKGSKGFGGRSSTKRWEGQVKVSKHSNARYLLLTHVVFRKTSVQKLNSDTAKGDGPPAHSTAYVPLSLSFLLIY